MCVEFACKLSVIQIIFQIENYFPVPNMDMHLQINKAI